ncbi:hypothetical protein TorRG33x02_045690 [Trema orientale]|uniref:Uncharacterized protein n=1 Tax=Trema orientale TaxID=63057 RepID=A0A2P5FPT1_TREOI|nr:hypothetical protein TorRG33x02_045690 [Trema orientale]
MRKRHKRKWSSQEHPKQDENSAKRKKQDETQKLAWQSIREHKSRKIIRFQSTKDQITSWQWTFHGGGSVTTCPPTVYMSSDGCVFTPTKDYLRERLAAAEISKRRVGGNMSSDGCVFTLTEDHPREVGGGDFSEESRWQSACQYWVCVFLWLCEGYEGEQQGQLGIFTNTPIILLQYMRKWTFA